MIALEGIAARRATLALASVSVDWGAGAYAVLGAPHDGGPLLLELIAGRARPRAGTIRVLDGAPTDASVRAQVAFIPLDPALPDALRVREALTVAVAVRKEAPLDPHKRLATLGVEALAERPVRSLSRPEARAVAIAEAATSSRVRVLLVEEPLVAMDPRAAGRLPGVLSARAAAGCAVVVATASARDASEFAPNRVRLVRGRLVGPCAQAESPEAIGSQGARLHVALGDARDARALVAALAREEDLTAVEQDAANVRLRGPDRLALARAAARAIVEAGVNVIELRFDHSLLDSARGEAT